jgi:putative spermidine/putrescine transport system ATP-binding protein
MDGLRDGEPIAVSLRPERVSFVGDGRKPNVLDCTIQNITFLGSIVRIHVCAGDNTFYMDTFNNPFLALPKIGDKAQVTFSREAPLILKRSAA